MRDPRLDALNLEKIPHVRFVIAVSDHPGDGREQAARLPGLRNAGQAHGAGRATHGAARARRPPLLPTSAAGTAACSAARSFPASPRSGLTPRPTRCSSSSQAGSPSVRALIAPEVLLANRRLHRPFSFTRFLTLPPGPPDA